MMRTVLMLAVLMAAAPVAASSSCPPLAWNDARTADPTPADIATLHCWSDNGSPEAGLMLAMLAKAGRGMAADPAEARRVLLDLAKGRDGDAMHGALSGRTEGYAIDSFGQPSRAANRLPYPPAMREYAKMLLLGQGGDRNIGEAKTWLRRAQEHDKEAAVLLKALEAKGL